MIQHTTNKTHPMEGENMNSFQRGLVRLSSTAPSIHTSESLKAVTWATRRTRRKSTSTAGRRKEEEEGSARGKQKREKAVEKKKNTDMILRRWWERFSRKYAKRVAPHYKTILVYGRSNAGDTLNHPNVLEL